MYSAGNEANFRTSAYEAITSYVTHATQDVIPVVQNTVLTILQRMEHLLSIHVCLPVDYLYLFLTCSQNQIVGVDDRNNWNELQSNFCSVIIVSVVLRNSVKAS